MLVATTTVEYAPTLLGTDVEDPWLSWTLTAPGHRARQTAYQVTVGSEPGAADVWDSGRVESDRAVGIAYAGPVAPRTRYFWRVRVWDGDGAVSPWSGTSWWETGLLGGDFGARWIGGPDSALLRKGFSASDAVRARLYVSGLAYYHVEINGEKVGDQVLDPGFTAYDRTVLYAVHDVTAMLRAGENAIGAMLGRGFYAMTVPNAWDWDRARWHDEPKLLARLEIEHADGTRTVVGTDETWTAADGPIRSDSLYAGETFDARLVPDGWSGPGFDDSAWENALLREAPAGVLRAQQHEPIKVVEDVEPVSLTEIGGSVVADLGRTMAGWTRLTVTAPAGTVVTLKHGEKLNADGSVEVENRFVSGTRKQTDEYVCAGTGRETWEPRFTYHGFRYVQISGAKPDRVTGRVVRGAVREHSTFRCSEPLFETFDVAMRRTLANNLHGIPTDTPLYEKNGWTGDAQLGAPVMAHAFALPRFFAKWIDDLADSQDEAGRLPVIVPSGGWGFDELAPAPEWTTVFPYLLREFHRWYGDDRPARRHWGALVRYLDWELARLSGGLATTELGDYLPPGYPQGIPPEDTRLTASAYLHRGLVLAAELGDLLGHDVERYRSAAAAVKDALNAEFLDFVEGHYRTATDPEYRQASNAIPLAFGLVPDDAVPSVVESLVADIRARGEHLNTGALGTSVLLPVLTAHGHADLAHAVATQREYPSWGYWFELGADTMWERWDAGARSRDHYFQGTVTGWLYENVVGLRPVDDGYARFLVRPDALAGLDRAETAVDTVRGRISVAWSRTGRRFRLAVEVPVGAVAEVHVPGRGAVVEGPAEQVREGVFEAAHGRYVFSSDGLETI
ncbi:family 78 glycoside hydrolase catalytic domain [Amycolatopsis minnesotensis]|uniref:alpha-L-rhamnosidase n=1 Tax=Amycolatopsis minnesotensis TaxID=337894 RepID=A0ABP5BI91_9PSEU